MEELPDDVLLMAMSLLDVPDLLACRLVCKRIGELALHPHVWRRQSISCSAGRWPACGHVLRFAPCLGTLIIDFPCRDKELQLYSATRCAVSSLSLFVNGYAPRDRLLHAAMIIRNQEALGRLRELTVKFQPDKEGDAYYTLLWAAAFTSGLEALTVNILEGEGAVRPAPHLRPQPPCASVKVFQSHFRPELIPFCEFVMAAHASTIEAVNFYYFSLLFTFGSQTVAPTLSSPTRLASLLAGMPNLRSLLGCPLIAGLEAVAACESLREVSLLVGPKEKPAVPAAAEFLRRAKQLRAVALKYYGEDGGDVGVDLVLALVSTGPSAVESLEIQGYGDVYTSMPVRQMLPLSRALPLMPALRKLTVGMTSREVLLAITPETNPALRTLELYEGELKDQRCAHHCLHSFSVVTVLSKNPSLELKVRLAYFCDDTYWVSSHQFCDWCKKDCHREVWGNKVRKAGEWTTIPRLVDQTSHLRMKLRPRQK